MKRVTLWLIGMLFTFPGLAQESKQVALKAEYYNSATWQPEDLVGKPIKPFSMVTPQGQKLTSEGLKGKVVVLDFWSTWCAPCRQLTAALDSALKPYYDQNFLMIGVNYLESIKPGNPEAYWKKHGYSFPMTLNNDTYGKSVKAGNPVVMVIDQQGIVRGRWTGNSSSGAPEVEAMVWAMLEKPEVSLQAVVNANRSKAYWKALYLYEALIAQDSSKAAPLAREKFQSLVHIDEWQAMDFAKEWLAKTTDRSETLSAIGDLISQAPVLAPKVNAYGGDTFEQLIAEYPQFGKDFIVHDLMGRCYFRSGDLKKALLYGEKSLSLAKGIQDMSPVTIEYLEGVLKKYQSAEKSPK